jgi:hypothetical protein
MMLGDFVFEGIPVVTARVRVRHLKEVTEFGEEKLAVGAFGGTGFGPAGDERIGGLNRHEG